MFQAKRREFLVFVVFKKQTPPDLVCTNNKRPVRDLIDLVDWQSGHLPSITLLLMILDRHEHGFSKIAIRYPSINKVSYLRFRFNLS